MDKIKERDEDIDEIELPEIGKPQWPKEIVKTVDILLDPDNPRLDLKSDASQPDIIRALFEHEKIMDLIESIAENSGFYVGENIIVIKDESKYIVLEGNRRVCAAQCMLDTNYAPFEYQDEIKTIIRDSGIDLDRLKNFEVIVSPDRESAQKIITARHTKYQIKKWSYLSKWRRDYKEFQKYWNVDKVSEILGEDRTTIEQSLKNYALIKYIRDISSWDQSERRQLLNNDLEVSVLPYQMSSEIQNMLGLTFDDHYNVQTTIDAEKFKYVIMKLTRSMFLNNEPKITTRTAKSQVKAYILQWLQEYDKNNAIKVKDGDHNSASNTSMMPEKSKDNENGNTRTKVKTTKSSQRAKPEEYFHSLLNAITVQDPRLRRLTYELAKNNMTDRPASGVLLIRALLESALLYRIDYKKLTEKLQREYKRGKDYVDLADLLKFSIKNVKELFSDYSEAKKVLEKIQNDHRQYMNAIVHGRWIDPTAEEIRRIAGTTRELLRTILTNSS
ncbi:hypothetical protein DMB44_09095 [Thermoplasma sp. Kam2015]|uniref:ParB N-terminal domain-containing protein n=1 Tax=Thermoplasma sp. Kam2015 TaxID=2094122 RepID=UPI000D90A377|nr:ParB N-terminal domain-containing protein [Thermoplasma sp. Kam2015]PYB67478.1 hypothetical protein DMB44_09095 [Thermoplasma sp. Kam2015]